MSRQVSALWWRDKLDQPAARKVLAVLNEHWLRVAVIKHASGTGGNVYPILDALCMAGLAQKRAGRIEQYRLFRSGSSSAGAANVYGEGVCKDPSPNDIEPGPMGPVDSREPDELTEAEWEQRRQIGLEHAYAFLDRLGVDRLGSPDREAGECGECGHRVPSRWSFGKFELCRRCRERRGAAMAAMDVALLERAVIR